jgi:hypothetical protein
MTNEINCIVPKSYMYLVTHLALSPLRSMLLAFLGNSFGSDPTVIRKTIHNP